jgi:hypothetical protein
VRLRCGQGLALPVALAALSSCAIEVDGPAGRTCFTANDCPEDLVCLELERGQPRTCQALLPAEEGVVPAPDAGFADYCHHAKPVLDEYCVSCHGVPPTNRAPDTFRLDVYATDSGIPGAAQVVDDIVFRTVERRDMPPRPHEMPSTDERRVLRAWQQSGTPLCDGGS